MLSTAFVTQYRQAMRLQTATNIFVRTAAEITPFLLGPVVIGFLASADPYVDTLIRYLVFLGLFAVWAGVRYFAFTIIERKAKAEEDEPGDKKLLAGLLICSAISMLLLQILWMRIPYEAFTGMLALLGLSALRISLQKKNLPAWSHLASFIYLSGIGYLSFALVSGQTPWQPIFMGLGMGSMVLGFEIIDSLSRKHWKRGSNGHAGFTESEKEFARTASFLMVCGPVFVAVLSYMGTLPKAFLSIFITLVFSSKVITALKNAEKSGTLPESLGLKAAGISVLFAGIIAVASHLFL